MPDGPRAQAFTRSALSAYVIEIRQRERQLWHVRTRLAAPEKRQAFWLLKRQRPQQRRIDHAENRRRRADPHRQCHDGDQREATVLQQHSRAVAQVLPECLHISSYSQWRTTIGSTFIARLAGIQHASSMENVSNKAITMNVSGSVALKPKSRSFINLVKTNAPTRPITTPISANDIPCSMINLSTSAARAPSAIRIPISRVRCVTAYA